MAGRSSVRYYSGIHDPHVNPKLNSLAQRRHALMRKTGVTVVERQLRYRWEWGLNQRLLPDPRKFAIDHKLNVDVSPHRRAREKGIDLALGLDVVDLSLHRHMDVAVIVSSDTDLTEAARMVHFMTRSEGRVSVEAAVLNDRRTPILLEHYDYTHQLTRNDFEAARDDFDYRAGLDPTIVDLFVRMVKGEAGLPVDESP